MFSKVKQPRPYGCVTYDNMSFQTYQCVICHKFVRRFVPSCASRSRESDDACEQVVRVPPCSLPSMCPYISYLYRRTNTFPNRGGDLSSRSLRRCHCSRNNKYRSRASHRFSIPLRINVSKLLTQHEEISTWKIHSRRDCHGIYDQWRSASRRKIQKRQG